MTYHDIITEILSNIDNNMNYIIVKVINKLEENVVPTKELWALKWFDKSEFVIIGGNLDMAILEMNCYLKRKNLGGTISNIINMFADDFIEEIEDYIYTYDIDEDPNFGAKLRTVFTLDNVVSIMYDKLKENVVDNDTVWLEPVSMGNQ